MDHEIPPSGERALLEKSRFVVIYDWRRWRQGFRRTVNVLLSGNYRSRARVDIISEVTYRYVHSCWRTWFVRMDYVTMLCNRLLNRACVPLLVANAYLRLETLGKLWISLKTRDSCSEFRLLRCSSLAHTSQQTLTRRCSYVHFASRSRSPVSSTRISEE